MPRLLTCPRCGGPVRKGDVCRNVCVPEEKRVQYERKVARNWMHRQFSLPDFKREEE